MKTLPKIARYLGIALLVLLALLVAVVAYIALTFDPNAYKPQLVDLVRDRTGRTLTIPGNIELAFYPKLGLKLGQASLSERDGSETFAAVDSARIALELLPLLRREVVVDEVQVSGLRATVRRDEQGASNIDDLLGEEPQQPAPQPQEPEQEQARPALDIGAIDVRDAHLVYDDRQQKRRIEISGLDLESEGFENAKPSRLRLDAHVKSNAPQVDADVTAGTMLTLDLQAGRYRLQDLDLALNGGFAGVENGTVKLVADADLQPDAQQFSVAELALAVAGQRAGAPFELELNAPKLAISESAVAGEKVRGELKLTQDARRIAASFQAPSLTGTRQAFRLPALDASASVEGDGLNLSAKLAGALAGNLDTMLFESPQLRMDLSGNQDGTPLKGSLSTPVTLDLEQGRLALPKLAADFALPNPAGGTLALSAQGKADADLERESVSAALQGELDGSAYTAQLGMNGFAEPAYRFDIGIDRLDLDRYRAAALAAEGGAPKSGAAADAQSGAQQGPQPDAQQQETPIDLGFLRELRARGSLRVGALKAAGIDVSTLRADVRAESGRLQIEPLSARLYGGTLSGSASAQAGDVPRFALRQKLAGINVGPLLQDAAEQDTLSGRGDVQIDLSAAGATTDALVRALDGSARVALHDGAIRGFNIAQILRNARARIDALRGKGSAAADGTGTQAESTDFSELTGSFRIEKGVARNDDLDVKSPLLRVAGSGSINLPERRLDYVARTTVVASLQGQGGPELQALKGLTVPVHLQGPFDAIGWKVDVAAMASELARQKLGDKAQEAQSRVKKSLDEEKSKVKEELQEQLRGLFGK